jgi:hypothetical protein
VSLSIAFISSFPVTPPLVLTFASLRLLGTHSKHTSSCSARLQAL